MKTISSTILRVMREVFDAEAEQITEKSNQDNVGYWDSLKHLDLILALEEEFKITFPLEEIGNLISFKLIKIILEEQLKENEDD
jgi:acyl carrier protein